MNMPTFSKTRIAPTPSGYLHVGNVLSFALTAALAEQTGAKILLRIDDLDRDRIQPAYVQDVFDTLNFMEIPWHEGPRNLLEYEREWSQMHRLENYSSMLAQLRNSGHVFACTCTRAQLRDLTSYPGTCRYQHAPLDTENTNWRLQTDAHCPITIKTLEKGIVTATLPGEVQDFVIRKKDGFPAYQLASVADDLHFGVDFIVRGADLWSSTLAQVYLAGVLQLSVFENAVFYHHSLLMESDDKKLSKSAGSTSVRFLRESGHKAADVYEKIGGMLGLAEPVRDWRELGNAVLQQHSTT